MAQIFSLKNSKFFSGLKKICAIVPPITTYVVMTRSETKLSVAILAPVSGQSAVNNATATSKCSITFFLRYDQDGDVKTIQDNVSNILQVDIVPGNLFVEA